MNENEFKHNGVIYVTEPIGERSCLHCAFCGLYEACIAARCLASQLADKTQMIYKEKQ